MTTHATWMKRTLRTAALLAAVSGTGCTLADQEAPGLQGPSEYGRSISVTATPDRLAQDGVSQVEVIATVRNEQGAPVPNFSLSWNVTASTGVLVEPSSQSSTTDAQGRARIVVTAPPPPAFLPSSAATLSITATPINGDALSTDNSRTVQVQLIPPAGTLPPNRLPEASFSVVPAVGTIMETITFDASLTTDEGEPCAALCTYQWNFGDFETASGIRVSHSFPRPGTYTVVLTVTDPRGGVDFTNRSLAISGPAAPTASFTATASGLTVAFNAAASAVGVGATITEYTWDFGDGTTQTTTVPAVSHSYPSAGAPATVTPYPVVLQVKDSFGRTAVTSVVVSVTTP
jgi:PKD repeat protein